MTEKHVIYFIHEWLRQNGHKDAYVEGHVTKIGNAYMAFLMPKGILSPFHVKIKGDMAIVAPVLSMDIGLHSPLIDDLSDVAKRIKNRVEKDNRCWAHPVSVQLASDGTPLRPLVEARLRDIIGSGRAGEKNMIYWYAKEVELPAFLDQTEKHMAKAMVDGLSPITLDDVIDFFVDMAWGSDEPLDDILPW